MNELAIMVFIVLVGCLAPVLIERRRCRCADAARTTEWRREDVVGTATTRGVAPSATRTASATARMASATTGMASATAEMAAAPARITRVGY